MLPDASAIPPPRRFPCQCPATPPASQGNAGPGNVRPSCFLSGMILNDWPTPLQPIDDQVRIRLICLFEQAGWVGPPVVVHQEEPQLLALTGAEALAAAREVGLQPAQVPTVHLRELAAEAGVAWLPGWEFAGVGWGLSMLPLELREHWRLRPPPPSTRREVHPTPAAWRRAVLGRRAGS